MKKTIYLLTGLTICFFVAQNAYSTGTISQTDTAITITGTSSPSFDPFHASTNVTMSGSTGETQFAVGAYHDQVLGKKSGKAFGMASDSSAMYYLDISDTTTAPTVTGSDSSAFSTYTAM